MLAQLYAFPPGTSETPLVDEAGRAGSSRALTLSR